MVAIGKNAYNSRLETAVALSIVCGCISFLAAIFLGSMLHPAVVQWASKTLQGACLPEAKRIGMHVDYPFVLQQSKSNQDMSTLPQLSFLFSF